MANKAHLSPGIFTSEKDLTFSTEALGVTTLGLVGETLKGPAFQPLFVKNYDEYKVLFGGTNPTKFKNTQIQKYELSYIAKSYLTQSNQLYVTRLLGLSGYDKGVAYAFTTIGAIDGTSVITDTGNVVTTAVPFTYAVTVTDAVPQNVDGSNNPLMTLSAKITALTGVAFTEFDTAFASFFTKTSHTTKDWFLGNIMTWGVVPTTQFNAFKSECITDTSNATPATRDGYELPSSVPTGDKTNHFYNGFAYNSGTSKYNGVAFAIYCHTFTTPSANVIKGTMEIIQVPLIGDPLAAYDKVLAFTLRSRGKYVSNSLTFDTTSVTVSNMTAVGSDIYASFDINAVHSTNGTVTYNVSLDKKKKNYIKSVLGSSVSDKETRLFVEESYDSIIAKGVREGKVKGIKSTLQTISTWDHHSFQYQTPATPFFVSEVRGSTTQDLFKLVAVSDGDSANKEIKASIANVDLDKKTFDVQIRAFNDSDKAPVILERFLSCSMDESLDSYVGRKIGTVDGKYTLQSSYVMCEMADHAPKDAVPAGFKGYEFRTVQSGDVKVPQPTYKTKYYKAGDTVVDPFVGAAVISAGDKVRKCYLGFTDLEYGFDIDLVSFKGKISDDGENTYNVGTDWSGLAKGFHMDSTADTTAYIVGAGTFTDPAVIAVTSHVYNDIKTRKFTALFAGGFDGWDEYRDSRTNTDEYKIGRTQFTDAGFDLFTSVEYNETFGTSDYYAYLYGAKTFENPEKTVINILATPAIDLINNTELVREVIEIIEDKRKDAIYLPTLPDIKMLNNSNGSNTENWLFPEDVVSELENAEIDSNYTAVYYPFIQIADTENSANLFIPPTAEVVRNLAFTDNIAHPWYATAGYNRGIVNCKKARLAVDQDGRDVLYDGRINPLATFTDVNVVIWGNRNLQVADKPTNRLNIRRLLLQAQKLIISVARRVLFDPSDGRLRNQFLGEVNPILDNIRKERGLSDFRVKLSDENAIDIDRNTMKGRIFLKPINTLEFIELEFNVTSTEVSFDNF